jgi:endonuclease/exonuclease/phosphatase (EEP) superfamily protein YafD
VVGDLDTSPLAPTFQQLLDRTGLIDGARGFGWQATWPDPLPAPLRIRLNHVLHSAELGVTRFEVGEALGSDHLPIVVELVRVSDTH